MNRSARLSTTVLLGAGLLGPLLALGGCTGDDVARSFGLSRESPDEFTVTTRAPLSMPPDYALRPPSPGAPRPQEQSAQQSAEATLSPQTALGAAAGPDSPGQQALVGQAGPAAPSGIRNQVDADPSLNRPAQDFTDRLMFWRATPPSGTVVDASAESQRLRQNAALGQSPLAGNTPIIQTTAPAKSGFLGIF